MLGALQQIAHRWLPAVMLAVTMVAVRAHAQTQVTTPYQEFGFNIGDDYHLVTYTQFEAYWRKLAEESPRMVLEEIGQTAEGRTQLMAIITSPENHRDLARYKEISRRLATADGLTDEEARTLADEGKAVVWIDGGLHASEIVGSHQLVELVYQMVSRTDEETMRILDDVILLAANANPDGMELQSSWYMRQENPTERSTSGLPRLYHKYVGHDNNRDSYMVNMPETANMNRVLFSEWNPQIMYNHHQTGPAGVVMFAPPFRDPFAYNLDPLVLLGIEAVGTAMHTRLVAEGQPGSTMRNGSNYSTTWSGCMRCTPYWFNMIGILTEINGNPTPMDIPLVPERQLPTNDIPAPIEPQVWHFRQPIEYSLTCDRAVLDYASRNRDNLLHNVYVMANNSIERGSRDNWTMRPQWIDEMKALGSGQEWSVSRGRAIPSGIYDQVVKKPENRDPRGYIIPADQTDFPTATKFVNTLMKNGIKILWATRDFQVAGKLYPSGSYVVKTAQAFRAHIMDSFEPQLVKDEFLYPGGPPVAPYDVTGWTLAYQMDVEFDRILEGFEGPFEEIEGFATVPAGTVADVNGAEGFLLSHGVNDAFIAMNRLVAEGENVYWLTEDVTVGGNTYPAGTIYIRAGRRTAGRLAPLATDLGLDFEGVSEAPRSEALKMRRVRIGLWDRYGGSMPSGWTRWLFEQFEFPFEVVYPQRLNAGRLSGDFDVLVFVDGAIPAARGSAGEQSGYSRREIPDMANIPAEYHGWVGSVTADTTIPQLRQFLEDGGTIIAIGSSAMNLSSHFDLPVSSHLVDDAGRPLSEDRYYIPGTLIEARVDNSMPLAYGMENRAVFSFNRSPAFRVETGAEAQGVRRVAWYDTDEPLRSGWAVGQEYLHRGGAVLEADVGEGKLYLFGPGVLERAQPHGTFKFLFNGIYLSTAEEDRVR